MDKIARDTIDYFRPPADYFWKWGDKGATLDWSPSGFTICYREDVINILEELKETSLIPFPTLLLILGACRALLDLHKIFGMMRIARAAALPVEAGTAFSFLRKIEALPEELRTGRGRIHLVKEISKFASTTPYHQSTILSEFTSGKYDAVIFGNSGFIVTQQQFANDIEALEKCDKAFPTTKELEHFLRTGLKEALQPAPVLLPDETESGDLLDELARDEQTAGLSRLTKRLIAALNIPHQSRSAGDQSFGGISDITNRGNYDQLLLSELAYDDELLMARLVNNEALYFRREQPPHQPKQQRTILLDTTLRLWGLPRIFAVAAAMACAQKLQQDELVRAITLGATTYAQFSPRLKKDIVRILEQLDPALHCGQSLTACFAELQDAEEDEFFFITTEGQLERKDFHPYFSAIRSRLHFVITVSRDGSLVFYSYHNSISKKLLSARLDLEALLHTPVKPLPRKLPDSPDMPAFMQQYPAPLYFPPARINFADTKRMAVAENIGLFVVTTNQRLLWFNRKDKLGKELSTGIAKGEYFFSYTEHYFFLAAINRAKGLLTFYRIGLDSNEVMVAHEMIPANGHSVSFGIDHFYITGHEVAVCSYQTGKRLKMIARNEFSQIQTRETLNLKNPAPSDIARYIQHNFQIVFNITEVTINEIGHLVLAKHYLTANNLVLQFMNGPLSKITLKICQLWECTSLSGDKQLRFKKGTWKDGSTIILDARGFIHLRSSNPGLPEITIATILARATAAWASDGTTCGNPLLTGISGTTNIPVADFYRNYIQPYIDHLQ